MTDNAGQRVTLANVDWIKFVIFGLCNIGAVAFFVWIMHEDIQVLKTEMNNVKSGQQEVKADVRDLRNLVMGKRDS